MKWFLVLFLAMMTTVGYAAPVTSSFGYRYHPVSGEYRLHTGTDYGYDYGTPIGSVEAGTVVFAGARGGYGNCVVIDHGGGDMTLYGHFDSVACREGDVVEKGTVVGYVGSTGVATGPHLHLEWIHDGEYMDPEGLTIVPVRPVDYGSIGFLPETDEKARIRTEGMKSLQEKAGVRQKKEAREWTAKDYLRAAVRRRPNRKDGYLATKARRKSAFLAAGIGLAMNKPQVVRNVVNGSINGFNF